jgi:epsilon-lactone hydrolase
MPSLKSKLIIGMVKNRHLLRFKLHEEAVTVDTDLVALRLEHEQGAKKFGKIPEGIEVIDTQVNGIHAAWIQPVGAMHDKIILYAHGGGYVSGSVADHINHVAKLVVGTELPALVFDYRLAPEHPFPAGLDDALAVYKGLLELGQDPAKIVIAGESAGGGLAVCMAVAIHDQWLALPAGVVVSSPWLNLTCEADSFRRCDPLDICTPNSWYVWNKFYYGDADPRNPWISPVYANPKGLPPVFIQVGSHEIMLDDSVRFIEGAKAAGVNAEVHIWDGMVHCFAFFAPMFDEATQAMAELCAKISEYAGQEPGLK